MEREGGPFVVLAAPFLATLLVYVVRRARITRPAGYFLTSTLTGYGLSLAGPVVLFLLFALFGNGPEVSVFYTILLSAPVCAVVCVAAALYWSSVRRSPFVAARPFPEGDAVTGD